jgi:hypothetical protein
MALVKCEIRSKYFIHSLIHNDTHGIVQQAFSENNGIQLGVYFVLVKYGQYCHRVGSR